MSETLSAFNTHFAEPLGRVSAVLQTIPGISTGNDGCNIELVSEDGTWIMSAYPYLDNGHDGECGVCLCSRVKGIFGTWAPLTVKYDQQGQVVEVRLEPPFGQSTDVVAAATVTEVVARKNDA